MKYSDEMGSKKISPKPKDINDLVDISYNPDRINDRIRYGDWTQTKVMSKWQEKEVQELFNKFGKCEKLPTASYVQTFDFKVDESELLVEVTSVNSEVNVNNLVDPDPKKNLEKLKAAMRHAEEKDSSQYPSYRKGIVIYCAVEIVVLADLWNLIRGSRFEQEFQASTLDYILFISGDNYPTLVLVRKGQLLDLFKKGLPQSYEFHEV